MYHSGFKLYLSSGYCIGLNIKSKLSDLLKGVFGSESMKSLIIFLHPPESLISASTVSFVCLLTPSYIES